MACGETVERATIVRVEGFGQLTESSSERGSPFDNDDNDDDDIKVDQVVSLLMQSRSQIHQLLPFPADSQVFDSFIYTFDDDGDDDIHHQYSPSLRFFQFNPTIE